MSFANEGGGGVSSAIQFVWPQKHVFLVQKQYLKIFLMCFENRKSAIKGGEGGVRRLMAKVMKKSNFFLALP